MGLRSRVLRKLFELLYDPLVFLHEPAGVCLFGASWRGRRVRLGQGLPEHGTVVDLGCGGGHLLSSLPDRHGLSVGIEPSARMAERAANRGQLVVMARAQTLPLPDSSVSAVVASYPGPWIMDRQTWDEIARVTADGALIRILMGGTVTRGPLAFVRRPMMRLLYGRQPADGTSIASTGLGHPCIEGQLCARHDEWGIAYVWEGVRRGN